ncbi:MAG: 6-phosphogluconolactonase [Deltaproteobacteria bacterium]
MSKSNSEIRVYADSDEIIRRAAAEFIALSNEAVRARGRFAVALSGGSTPRSLYALLAGDALRDRAPWQDIHFFWGDERHVPPNHADSNFRMANEAMLAKISIPEENIHRIKAENPDAARVADEYEIELIRFFNLSEGQALRFDLVLLGMGPDGHTASLFPGTDAIFENTRLVASPWVEKFGAYRITLTPRVINAASHVVFLAGGAEKAQVLKSVLEGEYRPEVFPSQVVRPTSGRLVWMVDRAAAQMLSGG